MPKVNKKEAEEIIYWAKRAYSARMVPGTSGNISAYNGKEILLSASGVCLGDMEIKDIAILDGTRSIGGSISGAVLNNVKPSSEKLMHLKIYEKRPDIKAIIHIHCPYTTSFAVCHKEMNEPILPEFIYNFSTAQAGAAIGDAISIDNKALRGIPSAKYALPSSIELAEEIANHFRAGNNAVLMENHGLVAGAGTLKQTFYILESIQAYAKTYFAAKFLGEIKTLNEEEVLKIKNLKG